MWVIKFWDGVKLKDMNFGSNTVDNIACTIYFCKLLIVSLLLKLDPGVFWVWVKSAWSKHKWSHKQINGILLPKLFWPEKKWCKKLQAAAYNSACTVK